MTTKEFERLTKEAGGESAVFYRGVTKKDYWDSFAHGKDYSSGIGIYGNGTYAAFGKEGVTGGMETAKIYAGMDGYTGRFLLDPKARVIDIDDLVKLKKSDPAAELVDLKLRDAGRTALALGYDALHISRKGYMIILNRSAIIVEEAL